VLPTCDGFAAKVRVVELRVTKLGRLAQATVTASLSASAVARVNVTPVVFCGTENAYGELCVPVPEVPETFADDETAIVGAELEEFLLKFGTLSGVAVLLGAVGFAVFLFELALTDTLARHETKLKLSAVRYMYVCCVKVFLKYSIS